MLVFCHFLRIMGCSVLSSLRHHTSKSCQSIQIDGQCWKWCLHLLQPQSHGRTDGTSTFASYNVYAQSLCTTKFMPPEPPVAHGAWHLSGMQKSVQKCICVCLFLLLFCLTMGVSVAQTLMA